MILVFKKHGRNALRGRNKAMVAGDKESRGNPQASSQWKKTEMKEKE
jgi:hypothetical protein